MQERRKADPPPLVPSDNQIVAGRTLSNQRTDVERAVRRNVDGEMALQCVDQEQTENQANGEERDIGQKLVVAKKRPLTGQGPRYDRRGNGLKRCGLKRSPWR